MGRMYSMTFMIPKELDEWLEQERIRTGKSKSEIIRDAIEKVKEGK